MGLNYTINCRPCCHHTELHTTTNRRTMHIAGERLADHVDTECAIRCPICRSRLNNTEADFRAQVTIRLEA